MRKFVLLAATALVMSLAGGAHAQTSPAQVRKTEGEAASLRKTEGEAASLRPTTGGGTSKPAQR